MHGWRYPFFFKEWIQHTAQHAAVSDSWRCDKCCETFDTQNTIVQHLQDVHPELSWENGRNTALVMAALFRRHRESEVSGSDQCPFCRKSFKRLLSHIAHHLQQIALFVVPRRCFTDASGQIEFGSDSNLSDEEDDRDNGQEIGQEGPETSSSSIQDPVPAVAIPHSEDAGSSAVETLNRPSQLGYWKTHNLPDGGQYYGYFGKGEHQYSTYWHEYLDASQGQKYYYNNFTKESQWLPPRDSEFFMPSFPIASHCLTVCGKTDLSLSTLTGPGKNSPTSCTMEAPNHYPVTRLRKESEAIGELRVQIIRIPRSQTLAVN